MVTTDQAYNGLTKCLVQPIRMHGPAGRRTVCSFYPAPMSGQTATDRLKYLGLPSSDFSSSISVVYNDSNIPTQTLSSSTGLTLQPVTPAQYPPTKSRHELYLRNETLSRSQSLNLLSGIKSIVELRSN